MLDISPPKFYDILGLELFGKEKKVYNGLLPWLTEKLKEFLGWAENENIFRKIQQGLGVPTICYINIKSKCVE